MGTTALVANSTIRLSPGWNAVFYWGVWALCIACLAIVLWAALKSPTWARWTTQDILIVAALGVLLEVYDNIIGDQLIEPLINPLTGLKPHEAAQLVGMVFQNPNLQLINQTVQSEVAFGPENLALPHEEIAARVGWCLDVTGMAGMRKSAVVTLSGGQKQRTAIAATLATRGCAPPPTPPASPGPNNPANTTVITQSVRRRAGGARRPGRLG